MNEENAVQATESATAPAAAAAAEPAASSFSSDPSAAAEALQVWVTTYGLQIVGAILILIIGAWVAKLLASLLRAGLRKRQIDDAVVAFFGTVAYVFLIIVTIVAALGAVGVQTASFIAVIGAAGLAIGLALQGSLSNIASGVLIILQRPFRAGNFIEAGGVTGIVEEISLFATKMRTPDNKEVIVPNAGVLSGPITNFSARDTRRMDLVVGVSYSDDLDKVKGVLWDILKADGRILEDPAPTVGVLEMADSSVNFAVRPWVKTAEYWDVFWHLQETIKKRLDSEGISIPFPQRDVHLYSNLPLLQKGE